MKNMIFIRTIISNYVEYRKMREIRPKKKLFKRSTVWVVLITTLLTFVGDFGECDDVKQQTIMIVSTIIVWIAGILYLSTYRKKYNITEITHKKDEK